MLAKRHLRWLGHVIRMPDHRLPRQILYGKLPQGIRSEGGQTKRYKDHSKTQTQVLYYPTKFTEATSLRPFLMTLNMPQRSRNT
ncbi:hypothetical protein Hamer_G021399 [Homarus americanus]|uniref:Uncharacterized protein n=1 Tax=Homarus americanus TaxID=6706 RepID=A0A8J5JLA3_HOMAM|nr:hypothetical protein Hamer_G021399 [Homarus americanus]